MQVGTHIPPYLLLERFAKGRDVLDLCAPDEQGTGVLVPIVHSMTLVQRTLDDHRLGGLNAVDEPGVVPVRRVVASSAELPFQNGTFDMVLMFNLDYLSKAFVLDEYLRAGRSLLTPSGILALLLPNADAAVPGTDLSRVPDFLDLERLLRRFFPHIMMFAQQPLFGATLSPIGRRVKDDAPLLDDRLLPEEGEAPDFFLALCSAKYHRLDDTVIAQLPFKPMADSLRLQAEKFEGTIRLVQAEKKVRDRKLEQLSTQLDELNEQLLQAELETRERSSLMARVAYLDDQLSKKDQLVLDAERKSEEKSQRQLELEASVLDYQRVIRRLEQQISDFERMSALSQKERDDIDAERNQLLSTLHESQSALKAKQRQLDEQIEEVASREAELESLRSEVGMLRDSLHSLTEEKRMLTIRAKEQESRGTVLAALEKELEKFRVQSMQDRDRLEEQFEEEHRKLLEEITRKEEMRRKAHLLELQVKELELTSQTDRTRTEAQTEDIQALMIRVEMLQNEKKELQQEKRESDRGMEELRQEVQMRSDDLERSTHLVSILTARAEDAEQRSKALQSRVSVLQTELVDAEQRCKELQLQENRLRQLETRYNETLEKSSELEQALALADGRSKVVAHKSEHLAELEGRYTEAMQQVRDLKKMLQEQESKCIELEVQTLRLDQLEQRHRTALEQIELLQQEVEELRPNAKAASAVRKHADATESKYLEEQASHQKTRTRLLDAEGRLSRMESEVTDEQLAHQKTTAQLQEAREKMAKLEGDLTTAMEALAQREEGAELQIHTAAEKIKHMRNELIRLKYENETELLCVREDLETELRHSSRRLEAAQQEIWELREEVIRMKAQAAATAAAAAQKGINEDFQKTLIEQEALIESVSDEREALRRENEELKKSLLNREKNMRILATLLKREHHEHSVSRKLGEALIPLQTLDIKRLIEEEGGSWSDDVEFIDEPQSVFTDDEVVDAIMESVIVNSDRADSAHEPSMHFSIDTLPIDTSDEDE
ncbi:MAG: hypothetical protein JXX29_20400 [Deltaproteobacteria bacterium]|nr:hypothetical protein [Deltaproteobacteria bacterium]MBN2674055.1 hypothetical protein [Deltaproteobacteria bacterium]